MTALYQLGVLEALLGSSSLGVAVVDTEGKVRTWSRGAEQILGWLGDEVLDKVSPLEFPSKEGVELGIGLRNKEGALIDVELRTIPLREASGATHGTIAVFATTRRVNQRFQNLFEVAPDGIIEADREGRIVLVNRVAERLFGYTREELIGQPVEILVPEELRSTHTHHQQRYKHDPITRPMGTGLSLRGRRKDGSHFPVEISLSPLRSEDGSHVITVVRDISERKDAEDRLRAAQEEYTHELELRNREIERANQLKTEFLANMSHELRSPLHTIIGFAELLGEETPGELNQKQKRFIGHIHKDSRHLLDLINDLLDLNKIEAGRLELQPQVFDVLAVVEDVVSSVRARAASKSIEIQMSVSGPIAVFADQLRFKQILHNLLSNAVKFTPEHGSVSIEAACRDGFAEIAVKDNGIGIAEDRHQIVFDKFYQVSAATKGGYEGTGLGLAISKRLVEQHGGRIWLNSEEGKGSCFTFTMPLEKLHEESAGSGR
jgi:PAS domain S-box-containing protein